MSDPEDFEEAEPVEIPIDGVLDLHTFHPRELGELLPDYLEACRDKGILEVRVIHGKGSGALRKGVHALLERSPIVAGFKLAADRSSWGATLVTLHAAGRDAQQGSRANPSEADEKGLREDE